MSEDTSQGERVGRDTGLGRGPWGGSCSPGAARAEETGCQRQPGERAARTPQGGDFRGLGGVSDHQRGGLSQHLKRTLVPATSN